MRLLAMAPCCSRWPNAEALALAAALMAERRTVFLDAVPGARTLLVLFEAERFDLSVLSEAAAGRRRGRLHGRLKLQAVYDGPDCARLGPDVARRHAEADHVVAFLGFAPGFAYMTGGFEVAAAAVARVRVPAGSLAVAGRIHGHLSSGDTGRVAADRTGRGADVRSGRDAAVSLAAWRSGRCSSRWTSFLRCPPFQVRRRLGRRCCA